MSRGLAAAQLDLLRAIVDPPSTGQGKSEDLAYLGIRPGGTLDVAGALQVHAHAYRARLVEQMGETFATVWRVLGDDDFFAAATSYAAAHRSSSTNLSDYGAAFPGFLASSPWSRRAPFLADLARFEWTFLQAFHAPRPDGTGLAGLEALAGAGDLQGVQLVLAPAARLFASPWAVEELFRRRDEEEAPRASLSRTQRLLLHRPADDVLVQEFDAAPFAALEAIAEGCDLADALDAAVAADAAFGPEDASQLFAWLASSGCVEGWRRGEPAPRP